MADVSVIVPVYNKEKYIKTLLDQLSAQTFSNFEVLCVDNNSTDSSGEIIAGCAAGDARIRLLTETKQGVSAARNAGIRQSGGKYLIFCDADDEVEADYLATLVEGMAGREADVAAAGYQVVEDGIVLKQSPAEAKTLRNAPEAMERLFECRDYQGFLWNKIFDAQIIRERGLLFDEDIAHNEDRLFLVRFLLCASGMKFIDRPVYRYCLRADSVTHDELQGKGEIRESAITEFDAFERMAGLLKARTGQADGENYQPAYEACIHDMILSELRMFKRMVGPRQILAYRRSRMRYFARQTMQYAYTPSDDYEGILLSIFRRYGKTGVTYTRNPALFVNIGIL